MKSSIVIQPNSLQRDSTPRMHYCQNKSTSILDSEPPTYLNDKTRCSLTTNNNRTSYITNLDSIEDYNQHKNRSSVLLKNNNHHHQSYQPPNIQTRYEKQQQVFSNEMKNFNEDYKYSLYSQADIQFISRNQQNNNANSMSNQQVNKQDDIINQRTSFNTISASNDLSKLPHFQSVLNSKSNLNSNLINTPSIQNYDKMSNNYVNYNKNIPQTVIYQNKPIENQRHHLGSAYTTQIKKENELIFTPKIFQEQNRRGKASGSLDAYSDAVLQIQTENKYKNQTALTSQRNLGQKDYSNDYFNTKQQGKIQNANSLDNMFPISYQDQVLEKPNLTLLTQNFIQNQDSARTIKQPRTQVKNLNNIPQQNQYKNLNNIFSKQLSPNIIYDSKNNSNFGSSLERSKEKSKILEKGQDDIFKQLSGKINKLSQVKDSLWYLINSASLDHLTKEQTVPFPYLEKQQRIYEEISQIQVDLDYLMQLFQIHQRSILIREKKLVQRKKHYKHQLKKVKNQLQQQAIKEILEPQGTFGMKNNNQSLRQSSISPVPYSTVQNQQNMNSSSSVISASQIRSSSIEQDKQKNQQQCILTPPTVTNMSIGCIQDVNIITQKTIENQSTQILKLQRDMTYLQDQLDSRDKEIQTLKNSLKMLEEDRILEKMKYKSQANYSQLSLQSLVSQVQEIQIEGNKTHNNIEIQKMLPNQNSNDKKEKVNNLIQPKVYQEQYEEDSLAENSKFAELLNECDKHIHQQRDLFNESSNKKQKSQKNIIDQEILEQIMDLIEQRYRNKPLTSNYQTQSTINEMNDYGSQALYQSQNHNLSAYLNPNESSNQIFSNQIKIPSYPFDVNHYESRPSSNINLQDHKNVYNKSQVTYEKSRNPKNVISRTQEPQQNDNSHQNHKNNLQIMEQYQTQQNDNFEKRKLSAGMHIEDDQRPLAIYQQTSQPTNRSDINTNRQEYSNNRLKLEQKEQIFKEKFQKIKIETQSQNATAENGNTIQARQHSEQRKLSKDSDISEKIRKAEEDLIKMKKIEKTKASQKSPEKQQKMISYAQMNYQKSNQQNQNHQSSPQKISHYSQIQQNKQTYKQTNQKNQDPQSPSKQQLQKSTLKLQNLGDDEEDLLIQGIDQVDWPRGNPIDSSRIQSKNSVVQSHHSNSLVGKQTILCKNNDIIKTNNDHNTNQNYQEDTQIQEQKQFNRFGFKVRQSIRQKQQNENTI